MNEPKKIDCDTDVGKSVKKRGVSTKQMFSMVHK